MLIDLAKLKDQKGEQIFVDGATLEINNPEKPSFKVGEDLRTAFYGPGKRYRILEYREIKDKGWIVCAIPLGNSTPMYMGQLYIFILTKEDKIKKGMTPLGTLPKGLFIHYDVGTRTISLVGPGTGYNGRSSWKKI